MGCWSSLVRGAMGGGMALTMLACGSEVSLELPSPETPPSDEPQDTGACPSDPASWLRVLPGARVKSAQWGQGDDFYLMGNGPGPGAAGAAGFVAKLDGACPRLIWRRETPFHGFRQSVTAVSPDGGLVFLRSDPQPHDFGLGPTGGEGRVTYGRWSIEGEILHVEDEPGEGPVAIDASPGGVATAFLCAEGSELETCAEERVVLQARSSDDETMWRHVVGLADPTDAFLSELALDMDDTGGVTVVLGPFLASTDVVLDGEPIGSGVTLMIRFEASGAISKVVLLDAFVDGPLLASSGPSLWFGGLASGPMGLDLGQSEVVTNRFVARLSTALSGEVVVPLLDAQGYPTNVDIDGIDVAAGQPLLVQGQTYGSGVSLGGAVLNDDDKPQYQAFAALVDDAGQGLTILPLPDVWDIDRRPDGAMVAVGEALPGENVALAGMTVRYHGEDPGVWLARFPFEAP